MTDVPVHPLAAIFPLHEHLLIGRRGSFPTPPESLRTPSVVDAPLGAHSAKPDVFAEMIERWYPEVDKIELFRRGPARPGWALPGGNEACGPDVADLHVEAEDATP